MKRSVVVDIEATGIDPDDGHRIVELAVVELIDGQMTGHVLHHYINPMRTVEPYATEVHGLTEAFLQEAPKFSEIAEEFVNYIHGAVYVAHNTIFSLSFLNAELERIGLERVESICPEVVDTLQMARAMRPDKKNNLGALCEDLKIRPTRNHLIGTALDANLIASLFSRLSTGQQYVH